MFTKKYIFETRTTRSKRLFQTSIFLILCGFTSFILLCIYLPIYAEEQSELARQVFYQRSPDVIAVFTGDTGRLDYTFKKAQAHPSANIFITGVYAKNNLEILLKKQGKNISVEDYIESQGHHIDIEYLARNTIENGLATINYLSKQNLLHPRVLIISSDYHIFRIASIMRALQDESSEIDFYFESIPSDYSKVSNLQKLAKEVYKFFKTTTFLLFWERD